MTEAQAVNEMLSAIGQEPISNVTETRILLDTVVGLSIGSQVTGDTSGAIGFVSSLSGNYIYVDIINALDFVDAETLNTSAYTISDVRNVEIEFDPHTTDVQEVKIALDRLTLSRRQLLTKGYKFNTHPEWEFAIDGSGFALVSTNFLFVYPVNTDVIVKDGKLYNIADDTFVFTEAQTARVVVDDTLSNIPEPFSQWVTAHALSKFQMKMVGDKDQNLQNKRDEAEAKMEAFKYDQRSKKATHANSSYGLNSETF